MFDSDFEWLFLAQRLAAGGRAPDLALFIYRGNEQHRMDLQRPIFRSWTLSSILLAAAGATLVIAGLYFMLVRPPLLPEDVRYMALSAAQLDTVKPQLESWLAHVFQVMGGYVLATGVLTITLAATSFRAHHWGAAVGVSIGGAASIGWMAIVNFIINSDFKWVLLGMALLWVCSLAVFWLEKRSRRGRQTSGSGVNRR